MAEGTVTITAAGTYRINGTLTDGQLVVEVPGDGVVTLILDGADITSSTGSALLVSDAQSVVVQLADGTQNTLSDASTYAQTGTSTPPICTIVMTRYSQSSESNADAKQVKFIHAHQMAKKIMAYASTVAAACPSTTPWCRFCEAWETAMTNTRSKKISRELATRCCSCGSRLDMRMRPNFCNTVAVMHETCLFVAHHCFFSAVRECQLAKSDVFTPSEQPHNENCSLDTRRTIYGSAVQ